MNLNSELRAFAEDNVQREASNVPRDEISLPLLSQVAQTPTRDNFNTFSKFTKNSCPFAGRRGAPLFDRESDELAGEKIFLRINDIFTYSFIHLFYFIFFCNEGSCEAVVSYGRAFDGIGKALCIVAKIGRSSGERKNRKDNKQRVKKGCKQSGTSSKSASHRTTQRGTFRRQCTQHRRKSFLSLQQSFVFYLFIFFKPD